MILAADRVVVEFHHRQDRMSEQVVETAEGDFAAMVAVPVKAMPKPPASLAKAKGKAKEPKPKPKARPTSSSSSSCPFGDQAPFFFLGRLRLLGRQWC